MIYFDTTKSGSASHRSGLMRVTTRLVDELGSAATAVTWPPGPKSLSALDWLVTAELFSEAERPGVTAFLRARLCRTAAVFHDAIPLKFPSITWPQSVARHPGYMKLLADFDRVFAVSQASKDELEGFWRWLRLDRTPPVEVLPLGANFNAGPRVVTSNPRSAGLPQLLCVGIVEPRKNQSFLLDVCETLWDAGLEFQLHVIGRVNPHFGDSIAARLRRLQRARQGRLVWHEAVNDAKLRERYAQAHATVFPTIAEGCGLPLLESLWMGIPCVCSDLPVLRANADGGGCMPVAVNNPTAWASALRSVVTDASLYARLQTAAQSRPLPTWADTARVLRQALATP